MKIKKLVTIHGKVIDKKTILFTDKTRIWCTLEYPGHKKGCPNYNNKDLCPPKYPLREDILTTYDKFTLIYAVLDFKAYVDGMRDKHEQWSERQLRNPLYWQSQLKTILKEHIKHHEYDEMFGAGSGFWDNPSMEAAGINVMECLKLNNIDFETKPVNKVVMVTLLMTKSDADDKIN